MQPLHLFFFGNVSKLILEDLQVIELLRGQEVKQMEQLFQVILQWSSSEQQFVLNGVVGEELEELEGTI